MVPMWWKRPYEFCLCGIQLKTVHAHPAGNVFDVTLKAGCCNGENKKNDNTSVEQAYSKTR